MSGENIGLDRYQTKRDFGRTPEPPPGAQRSKGPLVFVVQKHRARQLHYDFRLELDGVLKSWSVPKGPSLDPDARRLAVMTEDHPLDYAAFEGVIPAGQYGAGEVIVWDNGAYSPDEGGKFLFSDRLQAEAQLREGLERGKISFFLRGHKLRGSWTLVKVRAKERDWLLIKHRDEYASPGSDVLKQERSVLSSRTIDEVKSRLVPDVSGPGPTPLDPEQLPGARPAPLPQSITPMLASLAGGPFSHPAWIFEPKLDGYRIIARVSDGRATLLSRRGNDVTRQYPELASDLRCIGASQLVLDGEVIAMDARGRQCFQCLQQYLRSRRGMEIEQGEAFPLVFYVFDILYLDGYDLRGATLRSRKGLLHSILSRCIGTGMVRPIDYFESEGDITYEAAVKNGLEGVIAKRFDSTYQPGKRSSDWLKIKAMLSDEFVVGGYSAAPAGRAETFSSLLLGYFDDEGKLIFAGHVGSGFDEQALGELRGRLDALRTEDCPFSEVPPLNAPTTWVRPELVAEVKFSEWTQDGRLRIPVFLRLREDKAPAEVHRTESVAMPAAPGRLAPSAVDGVIEQLQETRDSFTIQVEGNRISLTHMDKALWPAIDARPALTKRHLLTYLTQVSPFFLPHLKDRPLTLTRYPDGIQGEHFYQKHWDNPIPEFVRKVRIIERGEAASDYLICDNLATLLWLGQIANIEFHTWFSRIAPMPDIQGAPADTDPDASGLDYPDFIVFDLDPYIYSGAEPPGAEPELNRRGFDVACQVALWLKDVLDELSLNAFIKTSGRTGLHVYVPVTRRLDYKALRSAAELIGRFLVQRHPAEVTMEWSLEKRTGKVFIDYGQNVRGKTLASVYSPRPVPEATVSTPLRWDEIGMVYPTDFSLLTLPDRLKVTGDLWARLLSRARRDLGAVLERK
ncbi:MAG: DNA ligase D [Chloroflexi bacterium]|nr:DNA ligase D [Chloroflexota bacterium]